MTSYNDLCIDLQFLLDLLQSQNLTMTGEAKEELDRIWKQQEGRGLAQLTRNEMSDDIISDDVKERFFKDTGYDWDDSSCWSKEAHRYWMAGRASALAVSGTESGFAHEIWAAAQLAQGEGVYDGVDRISAILARFSAPTVPAPAESFAMGLAKTMDAPLPDAQPVSDWLDKMAAYFAPIYMQARDTAEARADWKAGWDAALSASQAHGKSEAVAYPKMPPIPKPKGVLFGPSWTEQEKAAIHDYARAYVDADRAQRPAAPLVGPSEELRHAGAVLSNIAFNLRQRTPGTILTNEDISALTDAWRKWDALALAAPAQPDAARMDWLSTQYVTVRTPLRYGSKPCFLGSPDDDDGTSVPWDIRSAIDSARKNMAEVRAALQADKGGE